MERGKDCEVAEHLVVGPFNSPQDWKIDTDAEPMTAMTWCWVGYESCVSQTDRRSRLTVSLNGHVSFVLT